MGLPTPYSFTDPLNPTPNPALESDEARVAFWEKQAQRLTCFTQKSAFSLQNHYKILTIPPEPDFSQVRCIFHKTT